MPVYYETWLYPPGVFPAELINTATSFVPVTLGVLALLFLIRRSDTDRIAYALAVLLIFTGMGSVAWHALRTDVTLLVDALPGVVYFAVLIFFWVYYLGVRYFGVIPLAAIVLPKVFLRPAAPQTFWIVLLVVVLACAAGLLAAPCL